MSIRRCGSSNRPRPRSIEGWLDSWAGHAAALVCFVVLGWAGAACSGDEAAGPKPSATTTVQTATTSPTESRSVQDSDEDAYSDSASDEDADSDFNVDLALWQRCDTAVVTATAASRLQCATVTVPLDHAMASGQTIELALIRVRATSSDPRGSIFVNFGGPGAAGVSRIAGGFRLDDETMAAHHLVGFDPRGVGLSNPLRCTAEVSRPGLDLSPDTPEEAEALDRAAAALARSCQELDGDLLPHLGSETTARDLDLLRRAVGDDSLRYVGFSYGTHLGLRYADLYPDRVERMVLDGVVDPTLGLVDLLGQQATGFDRALQVLDRACGDVVTCPEGGVRASVDRLMEDIEAEALGPVGPAELEIATIASLYSERLWSPLTAALEAAEAGDPAQLIQLHDRYANAVDLTAYLAVVCIDSPMPRGSDGWDQVEADLASSSPRFGSALANEVRACAHWPVGSTLDPTSGQEAKPPSSDPPPILVIGTTGDAATPVANAVAVADRLPNAGLVVLEAQGHTAYGRSYCVDAIVADYLDTGRVPSSTHRC